MKRAALFATVLSVCVLPIAAQASDFLQFDSGAGLGHASQGGILPNTADYQWWYGCSPTSAGMLMGYYDRNGYNGLHYDRLIPGVAQASTHPSTAGIWSYAAQYAIASPGHVADFYAAGYNGTGDDVYAGRSFDCLADFMGTSQDSIDNVNGGTSFYFFTDGSPLTYVDAWVYGIAGEDGMFGVGEYIDYCGYSVNSLFTQLTDNDLGGYGITDSFTFEDYRSAIDAGLGVMIHVEDHTMAGIGYDENGNIILYDTWSPGPHTMAWGGDYYGLDLWGVTVFELAGGTVPAPGAVVLAMLGTGCVGWLRRRRTV